MNHFRNMAYRDPKKRQMWLKVWFSTLEAAETENAAAFEVEEEEEEEHEEGSCQLVTESDQVVTEEEEEEEEPCNHLVGKSDPNQIEVTKR